VEGPACLAAVVEEAERLEVTVHRASQGSGVFLHTDDELDEMARIAAAAPLEVSLFARPGAAWVISPTARAHAGFGGSAFGLEGVAANLDDCRRAAEHGFRSVLIGDVGVLDVFGRARSAGLLPADMQAKVSVMLPASNPASAALFERLGASTINLPTDLSVAQIAAIRAAVEIPLDIYNRVAGQPRGLPPVSRDPRADPRRLAGLSQVRAAQRARRVSGGQPSRGHDARAHARAGAARPARHGAARALGGRVRNVEARRGRARGSSTAARSRGLTASQPARAGREAKAMSSVAFVAHAEGVDGGARERLSRAQHRGREVRLVRRVRVVLRLERERVALR